MTWWSWLMVAWLGLGFGVVIAHHLWIDYTVQDGPGPGHGCNRIGVCAADQSDLQLSSGKGRRTDHKQ
jgi:hypothetical protein